MLAHLAYGRLDRWDRRGGEGGTMQRGGITGDLVPSSPSSILGPRGQWYERLKKRGNWVIMGHEWLHWTSILAEEAKRIRGIPFRSFEMIACWGLLDMVDLWGWAGDEITKYHSEDICVLRQHAKAHRGASGSRRTV